MAAAAPAAIDPGTTPDNYSSKPNTNPYTGKQGTVESLQASNAA